MITGSNLVTPNLDVSNETPGDDETLTPDTPSKKCVITNEMLAKVKTKCKNHTYDQIGKVLGVQGPSLSQRVKRSHIEFTNINNDPEKCFFVNALTFVQALNHRLQKKFLKKLHLSVKNTILNKWQNFLECRVLH